MTEERINKKKYVKILDDVIPDAKIKYHKDLI